MAHRDWLGLKGELPERLRLALTILSFVVPLGVWSLVSYLPFLWHPLTRVTDPGGVEYFVEGMEVHPRGRGSKNVKSDDYPQRWFCRPVPRPAAADPKAARAEAVRIAESISRRPMRRMPYDPATASGNSPGYF